MPPREADGCHHPSSEEELAYLVKNARDNGKQLRVMGSTHSVWKAIVTDHFAGTSTPQNELTIVLDRYTRVFEARGALVEVQAGCHIGLCPTRPVQARIVERPADSDVRQSSPWHDGTWEKSLTSTIIPEPAMRKMRSRAYSMSCPIWRCWTGCCRA